LYIPTCITLVDRKTGRNHRFWSTDSRYKDLPLLDIAVATTSFPPVFPPAKVNGLGNKLWIDGGIGIDCMPVFPLIHEANVTEMYLVSYNFHRGGFTLPKSLGAHEIIKSSIAGLNAMQLDLLYANFQMASESRIPSYAFYPDFSQNFSLLDFNLGKSQYDLSFEWAKKHNPIKLESFKVTKKT